MLQRISIEGIEFPRLYIAENMEDVNLARSNGIPYIRWRHGQDELIKALLRPTLEKMFPGILWDKVLGKKRRVQSDIHIVSGRIDNDMHTIADHDNDSMLDSQYQYDRVVDDLDHGEFAEPDDEFGTYTRYVDIAEDQRDCCNDFNNLGYGSNAFTEDRLSIADYVGDLSSSVDIDALQKLGMLPKFVGDVADCIKHNISQSMRWTEGYTKKLGYPLGKFNRKAELPNLIIIDVSHSIPDGIAATMLTLADTLRSQCNAELIITSRRSGYYPVGAELPKPQTLRDYYGRSNESTEFMAILEKYIAGREFGHVISFGDNDNPGRLTRHYDWATDKYISTDMAGTKVHAVHHYHTYCSHMTTGYARWVDEVCPKAEHYYDTSWCEVINKKYKM